MDWKELALGVFASLGGMIGIILLTLRFIKNRMEKAIDEKISLKYKKDLENHKANIDKEFLDFKSKYDKQMASIQSEYNKELEMIKSKLVTKNHVSKVRFDKEFEIYQKICKALYDVYDSFAPLLPFYEFTGLDLANVNGAGCKKNTTDRETILKVIDKLKFARNVITGESPFIKEEIYNVYVQIINLFLEYINEYNATIEPEEGIPKSMYEDDIDSFHEKYKDFAINTLKKREELLTRIRIYLKSLEVYQ